MNDCRFLERFTIHCLEDLHQHLVGQHLNRLFLGLHVMIIRRHYKIQK